jgi:hypothetical protein
VIAILDAADARIFGRIDRQDAAGSQRARIAGALVRKCAVRGCKKAKPYRQDGRSRSGAR